MYNVKKELFADFSVYTDRDQTNENLTKEGDCMETMAIGLFAVMVLIVSGCCLYYKKPFGSFGSNIIAMALIYWTGYSWKSMLINSGKDTTLLGFNRYPTAFIILALLLLTAFILLIVSIMWMARQNKSKG